MLTALEEILISSFKEGMIAFLNTHPEYFDEAVKLAIDDKPMFSWRAAWLLWSCMEDNDPRIKPYVKKIISSLENKKDGHQRELLKILLRIPLTAKQEAYLFDLSMDLWGEIYRSPSIRHTAFKVILKVAGKHPDLAREIDYLVSEQYMDTLSPGVRRSVAKMIRAAGIKIRNE